MKKAFVLVAPLLLGLGLVDGCGGNKGTGSVSLTKEVAESAVAGVTWSYPSRWTKQGPRQLRAATYTVPSTGGEQASGECAVFFFGAGQGGDVGMNIERWASQFQDAKTSDKSTLTVSGLRVTTVTIEGTYLAPSGPMMQSAGSMPGYKLLGGIVEAPQGMVFFKLTAPGAVADAASSEFRAMLESIVRQ